MKNPLLVVVAVLIVWGAAHWLTRPTAPAEAAVDVRPVRVDVRNDPQQIDLEGKPAEIAQADWTLTPLAEFHLAARVLAKESYAFDAVAKLAPFDLALGWGPMAQPDVLQHIEISQSNRFYFWRTEAPPIPTADIVSHSANMHIIPADREVLKTLAKVKPGQTIRLHGLLIEARNADGGNWRSSLTRTDSGNGACEIVWVRRLEILP